MADEIEDLTLAVECPTCGSPIGDPCTYRGRSGDRHHATRGDSFARLFNSGQEKLLRAADASGWAPWLASENRFRHMVDRIPAGTRLRVVARDGGTAVLVAEGGSWADFVPVQGSSSNLRGPASLVDPNSPFISASNLRRLILDGEWTVEIAPTGQRVEPGFTPS